MSGSRPCTGDGADSSGSGDVEKGGKREEEREIERSERGERSPFGESCAAIDDDAGKVTADFGVVGEVGG